MTTIYHSFEYHGWGTNGIPWIWVNTIKLIEVFSICSTKSSASLYKSRSLIKVSFLTASRSTSFVETAHPIIVVTRCDSSYAPPKTYLWFNDLLRHSRRNRLSNLAQELFPCLMNHYRTPLLQKFPQTCSNLF